MKGFWTREEDAKLIQLKVVGVPQNDANANANANVAQQRHAGRSLTWAEIAENIHSRSAKQCRERWINSLNPDLKKGRFSAEEDKILTDEWKR